MTHPDDLTPNFIRVQKTPQKGSIKRIRIFKCHNCEEEFVAQLATAPRLTVYCPTCRALYLEQLDYSELIAKHSQHSIELLLETWTKTPQAALANSIAEVLEMERKDVDMLLLKYRKFRSITNSK